MENRGKAVAVWGIALSIGSACCPLMPQSMLCMALYIVACNAGDAVYGSVLRAIVGIMRAY